MKELTLTQENFKSEVLESDIPVLVDFWATWCGPCMMLGPVIEEIANESDGSYKVGKVNVDDEPVLAAAYKINVIPTVIAFKNGKPADQITGVRPKEDIEKMLK